MEKNASVLMVDLTGYTAMTDVHGGKSAARMISRYQEYVDRALCGDTRIIQRVGDQIVLLAENPADALETICKLKGMADGGHCFLSIHAGIHYGPVFIHNDNLYGSTINIASRLMNLAERGQVLCSSAVVDIIDSDAYTFKNLGHFSLKNVLNEVLVYELITAQERQLFIDPVCRMQIDPEIGTIPYVYNNQEYHFCGADCLQMFKANPEAFLKRDRI